MALTGDQRALLKLVAERGQSYRDIAGLLGTDAEDVRERARRALAAAAGADLDRSANVTDFLLGQADPIARADAVRHLSRDSEDRDRAERALLAIAAVAPNATLPALPEERAQRTKPATRTSAGRPAFPRLGESLATPQRRLVGLIGAVALILIVAVVAIAGGDGDDDGGFEPVDPDFVSIELSPAAGVSGSGTAIIGQTDEDQPFIELDLAGLGEVSANSSYVLWLLVGGNEGIPVRPLEVSNGQFSDRMPLESPTDSLVTLCAAATEESCEFRVAVMNTEEVNTVLSKLIAKATENPEQASLPITRYDARTILAGEMPNLAALAEQAQQESDGSAEDGTGTGEESGEGATE